MPSRRARMAAMLADAELIAPPRPPARAAGAPRAGMARAGPAATRRSARAAGRLRMSASSPPTPQAAGLAACAGPARRRVNPPAAIDDRKDGAAGVGGATGAG